MVNDITREWWRDELSRNWTNGRLQMWLSEIVQFHQTENDSNGSNDWTSNMTRIVRRHLEQILTVQHWAEIMETNVNTLRQRCKKETGQSALKFLETIKLDTARILLRTTDHPIEFIAIRSGFSSRSVFTRWFRNKEGCSPRTWREEISLTR